MPIQQFVNQNGLIFKAGGGFYQFTKPEGKKPIKWFNFSQLLVFKDIQEYKEIVLQNIETGDIVTGEKARVISWFNKTFFFNWKQINRKSWEFQKERSLKSSVLMELLGSTLLSFNQRAITENSLVEPNSFISIPFFKWFFFFIFLKGLIWTIRTMKSWARFFFFKSRFCFFFLKFTLFFLHKTIILVYWFFNNEILSFKALQIFLTACNKRKEKKLNNKMNKSFNQVSIIFPLYWHSICAWSNFPGVCSLEFFRPFSQEWTQFILLLGKDFIFW